MVVPPTDPAEARELAEEIVDAIGPLSEQYARRLREILTPIIAAAFERVEERYRLALESLTPGGSEYVRDPERCVAYVQGLKQVNMDTIRRFKQRADAAEAENARLKAEMEHARAANGYLVEMEHAQREADSLRAQLSEAQQVLRRLVEPQVIQGYTQPPTLQHLRHPARDPHINADCPACRVRAALSEEPKPEPKCKACGHRLKDHARTPSGWFYCCVDGCRMADRCDEAEGFRSGILGPPGGPEEPKPEPEEPR